ncbi:MAG TPA: NAD(P)H-binding protein [Caulobacteraceae bacterium]
MTNQTNPLALVIGATGGIGGELADLLSVRGWRVRALHRDPERARAQTGRVGLEWVKGDASIEADVVRAAAGASVLVHGANTPGYRNWGTLHEPMLKNSIAAARASGARILFPGAIYNFGPDTFPSMREDAPQKPLTRKGAIRVKLEQALRDAADDGVRSLVVRAGDFIAKRPGTNWLSQGMVKVGRPITSLTYPGPLDVAHGWVYLPDFAETFVRLIEAPERLGSFEVFHMRGHAVTGHEFVAALQAAAGRKIGVQRLPWFAVAAAAPFNETFRETLELRYLWDGPVLMDNAKLVAHLGAEPQTSLTAALRVALAGMGALPTKQAVPA